MNLTRKKITDTKINYKIKKNKADRTVDTAAVAFA